MNTIDFDKIKIRLINEDIDLNQFNCGNNDLNEFLKEDCIVQKKIMLNTTYLCIYNKEIVGFITISTDSINIKELGEEYEETFQNKEINYKRFPAIKIGRLAVDNKFQNKGIGEFLLHYLFEYLLKMSKELGFRFLSIDAYLSAYEFYTKNYFEVIPSHNEKLEKIFQKFENSKIKNPEMANRMTISMFFDLYNI